jgi:NAD(P)-dependent dehydrogenase (short-subunit alcohol dehydrogenase family)
MGNFNKTPSKVAVVTGATGDIGWAITQRLVLEGYYVHAAGRQNHLLHRLQREVLGASSQAWVVELTNAEDTQALGERARATIGRIDLVVACAGRSETCSLQQASAAHYMKMFEDNVIVAVNVYQATARHMAPRGNMVFIGSDSIALGSVGLSAYAAAKAALRCLVKSWSIEQVRFDVRVNMISPGPVRSKSLVRILGSDTPEALAKFERYIAPRVLSEPEDVAGHVMGLLTRSDVLGRFTGKQIVCYGDQIASGRNGLLGVKLTE